LRVGRGGVLLAIVWSAWTRVLRSCRDCEWAARAVEEVGGGATAGGEDWLSAGCSRRRLRESTREEGFHLGCRVWVSARHLHQRGLWGESVYGQDRTGTWYKDGKGKTG